MRKTCRQCGRCCEIISLRFSTEELKNINTIYDYDKEFILKNWKQITNIIDIWRIVPDKVLYLDYNYYYTCNKYNKFTHKCMDNDNKPPVCSDYPYYGKDEHVTLISDKCIFNED